MLIYPGLIGTINTSNNSHSSVGLINDDAHDKNMCKMTAVDVGQQVVCLQLTTFVISVNVTSGSTVSLP